MKAKAGPLMTVAECAADVRMSHWTIRRLIQADRLPAFKFLGRLLVKRSDWLAFRQRELAPANAIAIGNRKTGVRLEA